MNIKTHFKKWLTWDETHDMIKIKNDNKMEVYITCDEWEPCTSLVSHKKYYNTYMDISLVTLDKTPKKHKKHLPKMELNWETHVM